MSFLPDQPEHIGADDDPGDQVTECRPQAEAPCKGNCQHSCCKVNKCLFEKSVDEMLPLISAMHSLVANRITAWPLDLDGRMVDTETMFQLV